MAMTMAKIYCVSITPRKRTEACMPTGKWQVVALGRIFDDLVFGAAGIVRRRQMRLRIGRTNRRY